MKKIICLLIALCFIIPVYALSENYLDIADGIRLGMTKKEAINASLNAGNPIDENSIIETRIAGEPFTYVYFSFVDSLDSFSANVRSDDAAPEVMLMNEMMFSIGLGMRNSGYSSPLTAKNDDANEILVQACAYFTSDNKYATAVETYEKVEDYLTNTYGETRYTYRRGQSLPLVDGYYALPPVITKDNFLYEDETYTSKDIITEVQNYSQRILKVNDNCYVIVDHHIYITRNTKFSHRIVFTLVPESFW